MLRLEALHEAGSLWRMLANATAQLESDPPEAERQAKEVLRLAPGLPQALQLLVDARRANGDLEGARALLEEMVSALPDLAAVHYELGVLLLEMGDPDPALHALRRTIALEPKHAQAWGVLGGILARRKEGKGAADAFARQFELAVADLKMLEQAANLDFEHRDIGETVLREYLNVFPTDIGALYMLASLYLRVNHYESAEKIFQRTLDLAPSFRDARLGYAGVLHQQLKSEEEIEQLDILLDLDPENREYLLQKAMAMSSGGKVQEAVRCCEDMLATIADYPKFWLVYAHVLRVAGRQDECIKAYQKALQLDSRSGEAWWGLANLKTFRFDASHVEKMRNTLGEPDLSRESREYLNFALGKALEDLKIYQDSFQNYSAGNTLIRQANPYDIGDVITGAAREKRRFTSDFFEAQAERGCLSSEPIFILGLPRSGSTLIEQILASHSLVEGGGELASLTVIARQLEDKITEEKTAEDADKIFQDEELKALGNEYLELCRPHRKLQKPYFTDKMPSNFRHLGILCSILPNAKIIDARRHPMACCFSNFKQIFPYRRGPSYDLEDIGRYYAAYVELLQHFDRVLPGRIHRVMYEELVQNPEAEVARLLEYCELPFEEKCLRFYETDRDIRTISSEQVRRPIYRDAMEQWRHYEPWLGPLKKALGEVLTGYPGTAAHPERMGRQP